MTTAAPIKNAMTAMVSPLIAAGSGTVARTRQFWAFARLGAKVGPLDPSTVVLGMPELHGTCRIELGRNLYLYRDLHLQTRDEGVIRLGDDVVLSRGVHIVAFDAVDVGVRQHDRRIDERARRQSPFRPRDRTRARRARRKTHKDRPQCLGRTRRDHPSRRHRRGRGSDRRQRRRDARRAPGRSDSGRAGPHATEERNEMNAGKILLVAYQCGPGMGERQGSFLCEAQQDGIVIVETDAGGT